MTPDEFYTAEVLAITCPKCKGVNRCLEPNLYGSKYIDRPHTERVELASSPMARNIAMAVQGIAEKAIAEGEAIKRKYDRPGARPYFNDPFKP